MKKIIYPFLVIALANALLLCSCNGNHQTSDAAADSAATRDSATHASKVSIASLLQQDSLNAAEQNGNDAAIATGMRKLDLSKCPRDFAVAYVDHMHAWEDAAEIQQALAVLDDSDVQWDVAWTTLIQKLTGKDYTASDELQDKKDLLNDAAAKASEEIHLTYNEVERVATAYGVTLH